MEQRNLKIIQSFNVQKKIIFIRGQQHCISATKCVKPLKLDRGDDDGYQEFVGREGKINVMEI